jgi:hypothetical protein
MIQPTYVTYTQAVWLKEKGFDIPQNKMYSYGPPMFGHVKEVKFYNGDLHECASTPYNWNDWSNKPTATEYYSAPEQWLVIEWLRVNHGIWISVKIAIDDTWYFEMYNLKDKRNSEIFIKNQNITDFHKSHQDAYSAAFDYIISNNLI